MYPSVLPKNKCVYVIYNKEFGLCKIGISNNPLTRLENLEIGCGCDLEIYYNTFHILNAQKTEAHLHHYFRKHRKKGEWFKIHPEDVVNYIKTLDLKPDELSESFISGESISNLAKNYNVSRAAITTRLKSSGLLTDKKKEFQKIDISKYKRIAPNIYVDNEGKEIKVIYKNGIFFKEC